LEGSLKRSELKSIVKECLLEILMEGVANGNKKETNLEESRVRPQRRTALDYISAKPNHSQQSLQQNKQFQKANVEIAKQIVPNDPVMASIFADTASTTLREQVAADSGRQITTQDTGVDPMSLFENSENWAKLAFADSKANRGRA
jgi:hypothetical protein